MAKKILQLRPQDFGYLGRRTRGEADYLVYTVSGRGHFPEDMLRYDQAEFFDEDSKAAGTVETRCLREVTVRAKGCTPERWRSFGWSVHPDVFEYRF